MDKKNIYTLFAENARATPDAVAIIEHIERTTSYAQLASRATQVAACLASHDVVAEEPVGIMMNRTSDMIAMLLGVLKHGAAYVPVDPDDPPARQRVILEQSGCRIVLADREHSSKLRLILSSEDERQLGLCIVHADDISMVKADPYCNIAPGGKRLAYILFTSGSTGRPKGVEVQHDNVLNLLLACRDILDFRKDDCFLAVSTIGFDISVVELFLPLVCGGRVLLRDRGALLHPSGLIADIRNHGVSFVQTGPSMWSLLLAETRSFPPLRVAISTAEAISVSLATKLAGLADHVWNLYGPTETTVWSTAYEITPDRLLRDEASRISVPIGLPIRNTRVLVVNEQGRPVDDGGEGELYIGGQGVARGYRGDEALTRLRFVTIGDERYYRTGDMVSWSREGILLYHGRNDDQIKIRGVRIDPGDVEAALLTHPAVKQVAATWYDATDTTRSIIAAIVCDEASGVDGKTLYTWLKDRLPDAMIPSRYVFLSSLPITPSGKIDRGTIRKECGDSHQNLPERWSGTPTEAALANIWKRVLQVVHINPQSHFFADGGDSLAAVRMLAQVESELGVSLPVQTVFHQPVLADLAHVIDLRSAGLRPWAWLKRIFRRRRSKVASVESSRRDTTIKDLNFPENQYVPVADVSMILPRQQMFVATWQGHRVRDDSLVVSLNAEGKGREIFWCLQGYRELSQLARYLGVDHPVHGMRSGFLIINYNDKRHIEVLAERYVEEIQIIKPEGPLVLGGNCQGGKVMIAIADKLRKHGRVVECLILMEQRVLRPYDGRVVLFFGKDSHLNPFCHGNDNPETNLPLIFKGGYDVSLINGSHGEFFESPNIESLAAAVLKHLV